jgi:RHS repeat-associated protein
MEKPGRGSNPTGYRFGFNGVEADNALMPGRTGYHTYFRQYDTRTARWFSVDPVVHPWQSTYNAMDGNPIYFADPGGANTIAREEDPDIFDTETTGTDPACPGPANAPTGGEWFKFENTIGFDPLAGIKNNISNPSTVNPPMQDNSVAVQNSYSFENNMQAEGGGEKAQSGGNPLTSSNGETVWSASQFYNFNFGFTGDQITNQRIDRSWLFGSQPGGPRLRYVQDPLSSAVIDMRHMLVIGKYGKEGVGDFIENMQWLIGQPSGRNPQDYFSNALGDAFYRAYGNSISQNPANFAIYLNQFLHNPQYSYIRDIYFERYGR